MSLPTQEYLQSRIDYNPQTGEARWKVVDSSFGIQWRAYNGKNAGKLLPAYSARIFGKKISTARLLYKLYHGTDPAGTIQFIDGNRDNRRISNLMSVAPLKITKDESVKLSTPLPLETFDLLTYDKDSGNLYWKPRESTSFNSRYAGKQSGCLDNGYVKIKLHGVAYKAHRLAWLLYYGIDPSTYLIDHIDGDRGNNCIKNLRLATNSLNLQAAKKAKGYSIHKPTGKYIVGIGINGVTKHIGTYDTEVEAKAAYNSAVKLYKPTYQFTAEEQQMLDKLYSTYPNCDPNLQRSCHDLQVKALKLYIDAAVVQTPNLEYNSSS